MTQTIDQTVEEGLRDARLRWPYWKMAGIGHYYLRDHPIVVIHHTGTRQWGVRLNGSTLGHSIAFKDDFADVRTMVEAMVREMG